MITLRQYEVTVIVAFSDAYVAGHDVRRSPGIPLHEVERFISALRCPKSTALSVSAVRVLHWFLKNKRTPAYQSTQFHSPNIHCLSAEVM